jgi:hypothetical protein
VCLAGDVNAHFATLATRNALYERPADRAIRKIIEGVNGLGTTIRNPVLTPTLVAGTTLDIIAASPSLSAPVAIQSAELACFRSDHLRLDASLTLQLPASPVRCDASSAWHCGDEWDAALRRMERSLAFIAGWAICAASALALKHSLVEGSRRGMRQRVVDIAVWWRMAVLTMAGWPRAWAVPDSTPAIGPGAGCAARRLYHAMAWG